MASHNGAAPPPYEELARSGPYLASSSAGSHDPRSSSMQSLVPERAGGRRKLLLIYIHGFMGNETSFQSFPAHVHNLVSILVAETHVVHTKVYPRYKSRRSMNLVAADFSKWLSPHESPDTDTILLGHSMGGLLSAEVILLSPRTSDQHVAFRHRILGSISFDVPFLGMHPGVISSGLASVFRSSPSPPESPNAQAHDAVSVSSASIATQSTTGPNRHNTLFSTPSDPNYNPKFNNDINIPIRKGWQSTIHFINKHSDGLRHATKQYVKSHVEFGGAMADFRGLHARYNHLRSLEDSSAEARKRGLQSSTTSIIPRVRFVNYYTACTGIQKKTRPDGEHLQVVDRQGQLVPSSSRSSLDLSRTPSPRISIEEMQDDGQIVVLEQVPSIPQPEDEDALQPVESQQSSAPSLDPDAVSRILETTHVQMPTWPPLSPAPMEPAAPNLDMHSDKHVRDALKKEHDRKMKQYKQEMKDRETTLADRKAVEDKIRKSAAKEILKLKAATEKKTGKTGKRQEKEQDTAGADMPSVVLSRTATDTSAASSLRVRSNADSATSREDVTADKSKKKKQKEPKERRFCVIPSKQADGSRDDTWVRVFMTGVDEVGAHCGLFEVNETYERLVGDVGSKIEEWVRVA